MSEASSPHHHENLDIADGEFIDLTIPATLSDSDSVTSPAKHKGYSSTSSDSSLSDSLQGSEANKNVTTSQILPPPEGTQGTPLTSSGKAKVDSPTTPKHMGVKPSALEVISRLRCFVSSRTLSSDSNPSQAHNDKMSPEAVKAKNLMTKIRTHALNPDLPHLLHSDPTLGPELSEALAQMKELNMSESARLMITIF